MLYWLLSICVFIFGCQLETLAAERRFLPAHRFDRFPVRPTYQQNTKRSIRYRRGGGYDRNCFFSPVQCMLQYGPHRHARTE
ncbi:unnamed protein product, partial [Mesorhabditis belari]|uniref:Secreted protein n=1 Tax=Mesorhabditis belari TaxID=2138241 RepID=A0AAF3EPC2_9BILA